MRASASDDFCGSLQGDQLAQFVAMIRKNVSLEQTLTEKQHVIDLLTRSFEAVRRSLTACGVEDLERTGHFFGEPTTVRWVYLRMLAYTHEHMGQAIAYARTNGIKVPWPDPLNELGRMDVNTLSRQASAGDGQVAVSD